MKSYFLTALALGVFVAVGAWAGRTFGLYNAYWFTDVILHLVSGVGFGLVWLALNQGKEKRRSMLLLGAASFAVLGSVAWEIWEFAGWRITNSGMRYYIPELGDTLGDISCGFAGGILAALKRSLK